MGILVLFFKKKLVKLRVLTKADVSEVVIAIKTIEKILNLLVREGGMLYGCVLSIHNHHNASIQDIMAAEHIIYYSQFILSFQFRINSLFLCEIKLI